jgi:thiamine transporter 2/3
VLVFVFLLEFKPSEPFIEPYLRYYKGFTKEQVNVDIFSVWTYSYLAFAFLFGPLTEMGTYRVVIIVGALARLSTRFLLLFGESVLSQQLMQVAFGIGSATEVATSAVLYTLVPAQHFQAITSMARAASLLSHVGAAELGQLLVDLDGAAPAVYHTYRTLMWISLGTVASATTLAFFLPITSQAARPTLRQLFHDGVDAYRLKRVFLHSVWWFFTAAVLNLCYNFGTSRFDEINPQEQKSENGHITAITRVTSSILALLAIQLRKLLPTAHTSLYMLVCAAASAALVLTAVAQNLMWCAVGYATSVGFLELLLCLIHANTAESLPSNRYALIIGINTFVALAVQSLVQLRLQQLTTMQSTFIELGAILAISSVGLTAATAVYSVIHRRPD